MSGRVIKAIVLRDLRDIGRSWYWLALGPVALAASIGTFWMLPAGNPSQSITVGLSPPSLAHATNAALAAARLGHFGEHEAALARGLVIVPVADADAIRKVLSGETRLREDVVVAAGIAFPPDFLESARTGTRAVVSVYLREGLADELGGTIADGIREFACGIRAAAEGNRPVETLPFSLPDLRAATLGKDRVGTGIPVGKVIRPMFSAILLMFASLTLAGLIALEIERRTVTAILVTPAGVGDVLAAKGITGTLLCSGQVMIYLLGTWRFNENWLPTVVLVILGALMMSAVGMIAGALGKGYMDTTVRCSILGIPLALPIFTMVVPETPSLLTRAMPSYGLVAGLFRASALDLGWSVVAPYMCMALAWDVALFGVALFALRRRVKRP